MKCKAKKGTITCCLEEGHEGAHRSAPKHTCHWAGCTVEVPPKVWGCKKHWFTLPKSLRNKVWATYVPGQEVRKDPSRAYMLVIEQVDQWIREHTTQQAIKAQEAITGDKG